MGMGLMAGLTVLQGFSQYGQAKTEAAAYKQQAIVDEQNARITERQREMVSEQSLSEQRQLLARKKLIAGQNAAAMGAGGVDSSSGTAFDLRTANEDIYKQDRQTLDRNLLNQDWDYRQNIANYEQSARANRRAAKNVKKAGKLNAILSTAVNLYGLKGMQSAKTTNYGANLTKNGSIFQDVKDYLR